MSVKAKEFVRNKEISGGVTLVMAVAIIGYVLFYEYYMRTASDQSTRILFNFVSMAIMIVVFVLMVRYVSTTFNILLTHARFEVERRVMFTKKIVANIPVKSIISLCLMSDFTAMDKVDGKKHHFTVSRSDLEDLRKYALLYEEDGKICLAEVQFSNKTYETFKKLLDQQ